MTLRVPQKEVGGALEYFVNRSSPQDLVLRLYVNDHTPEDADVAESYVEASGSGYEPIKLSGANWSAPTQQGAHSEIEYAEQVFVFSGGIGRVFGYYMARETNGLLALAERFTDGPYDIRNNGDRIKIRPKITAVAVKTGGNNGRD